MTLIGRGNGDWHWLVPACLCGQVFICIMQTFTVCKCSVRGVPGLNIEKNTLNWGEGRYGDTPQTSGISVLVLKVVCVPLPQKSTHCVLNGIIIFALFHGVKKNKGKDTNKGSDMQRVKTTGDQGGWCLKKDWKTVGRGNQVDKAGEGVKPAYRQRALKQRLEKQWTKNKRKRERKRESRQGKCYVSKLSLFTVTVTGGGGKRDLWRQLVESRPDGGMDWTDRERERTKEEVLGDGEGGTAVGGGAQRQVNAIPHTAAKPSVRLALRAVVGVVLVLAVVVVPCGWSYPSWSRLSSQALWCVHLSALPNDTLPKWHVLRDL